MPITAADPSALRGAVLIAITDFERVPAEELFQRVERLARAARPGTLAVQLRERTRSARALLDFARRLHRITLEHQQGLVINDRLDLAAALGTAGVHLGEVSVTPEQARRFLPASYVYCACHDPESTAEATADGLLLSPVLAPRKGNPALGLAGLSRARALLDRSGSRTRLFALGGVTAENAASCIAAGADGVAAIGAALGVDDAWPLLSALGIERR